MNSSISCKGKEVIQQSEVSDLFFAQNSNSQHLVLVNPEDPIAFAGAYFLLKNKAVPYLIWTNSNTAATIKSEMLSFLTSKKWKPQFITIIGHQNFIAAFRVDYTYNELPSYYVSDFEYSKLDSGKYHLVNLGRIVALQLSEALQEINRTFYYSFLNSLSKLKAAIHVCDQGPVSECIEAPLLLLARTLGGYLESKGFTVDLANNQNKSKFIQQLTANELVFKGNHGNNDLTSIYGDAGFSAYEFPVMKPSVYITASCLTANYSTAATNSASMLLSHIEKGGIGYIGSNSIGTKAPSQKFSFLTKNATVGDLTSGPLISIVEGHSYYGDPTFKLNYPSDTPSAISTQLTTISPTKKKLDVQIPLGELTKFANMGYLPRGFDKIDASTKLAWGIKTIRFKVEDSLTQVSQLTLSHHSVESGKNLPSFDNCQDGKKGDLNVHCYQSYSGTTRASFLFFSGSERRGMDIAGCDIDKTDFLESKTELVCDIVSPFIPLDFATNEVAKVLSYSIEITF